MTFILLKLKTYFKLLFLMNDFLKETRRFPLFCQLKDRIRVGSDRVQDDKSLTARVGTWTCDVLHNADPVIVLSPLKECSI